MSNAGTKDLSIVVIGRNEADNMEKLTTSLRETQQSCALTIETIFVDSASSDNSVELAKAAFDTVVVLQESPHLCAAAGRAVGTEIATGEWVLYLDADMAIAREFIDNLARLKQEASATTGGYIGRYIHIIIDDGSTIPMGFGSKKSDRASGLGGASLLRRAAVMDSGNWDASIFAHEELDLFARMRAKKWDIYAVDMPMIFHFTEKPTALQNLHSIFLPSGGLGKKYFGAGQLAASRWLNFKLGADIIKQEPHPFIIAMTFLVALALACAIAPLAGLALALLGAIGMIYSIGIGGTVVSLSKLTRIPFGISKYRRNFKPDIANIWRRTNPDRAD